jgi:hypothetical protein
MSINVASSQCPDEASVESKGCEGELNGRGRDMVCEVVQVVVLRLHRRDMENANGVAFAGLESWSIQ